MLGNEFRTPVQLFEACLTQMHARAQEKSYVSTDSVIIEELIAQGKTCVVRWLCDDEFKSGFENNPTSYYFGISVNLIICGMYYSDVWVNNNKDISQVNYTDIYEGGMWNNVLRLLESTSDNTKVLFQTFSRELFDIWTSLVRPYNKLSNFGEYLVDTLVAFFQIGVCIKLNLFGY